MNIKFSRHAKRRMKLYDITENDVSVAIKKGDKRVLPDGKIFFVHSRADKFLYPLKIVAVESSDFFLIITVYPLKKGTR